MNIHDVLDRDPRTARLANNGQARIVDTGDRPALDELRAELEAFVCDGQFGDALQRILDRYLTNLGTPKQDSAWVSGFFGSGKSHLLKMLAHLWRNTEFPDGSTEMKPWEIICTMPPPMPSSRSWTRTRAAPGGLPSRQRAPCSATASITFATAC